jgi:IS5 family transposase
MRQERTVQASLFDLFAGPEIGRELKAMSQWLDEHRELIGLAAEDLRRHSVKETGRQGLSAESVLRCGLLKQHRQLSYEELAFHLEDSASFRAFARLPLSFTPKKSVLHMTISAIRRPSVAAPRHRSRCGGLSMGKSVRCLPDCRPRSPGRGSSRCGQWSG